MFWISVVVCLVGDLYKKRKINRILKKKKAYRLGKNFIAVTKHIFDLPPPVPKVKRTPKKQENTD
jgi:hypothetical protein